MPLSVLIADDEPLARAGLRMWLAADADVATIVEARDGKEAVAAIRAARPDLVFLDVQMPELDGFGVVTQIGAALMPAVVFVTAHEKRAIDAFTVNAVDYLLKPVTEERFAAALARAKGRIAAPSQHLLGLLETLAAPRTFLTRLAVKSGDTTHFVSVADLQWIEAAENYVNLHVDGGASYLVQMTMTALERALNPAEFVRVHRSILVRVARIISLQAAQHGEYTIMLAGGTRLRSSRNYSDRLKALATNPF